MCLTEKDKHIDAKTWPLQHQLQRVYGAHVNWNVIKMIYGLGNATICMVQKESIYLF
jgi:hypothetical protein